MDARPGFPFRVFLPMAQLLFCILLLWPYWPGLRTQLGHDIRETAPAVFGTGEPEPAKMVVLNVTPSPSTSPAELNMAAIRLDTPAALNFPAGLIQLPFVLANGSEWVPEGVWLREWRAVSWPLLGLVFWWIAGRGLEALFSARYLLIRPSLRGIEVLLGVSLFVLGVISSILLASPSNPLGMARNPELAAGAALWSILGAIIVTARLLQWRIRRLARAQGIALVP